MNQERMVAYISEIETHRLRRQQRMMENPLNWFSLAGLFPLMSGENSIGNNPGCSIILPKLNDLQSGIFLCEGNNVRFQNSGESPILVNGEVKHAQSLRSDVDGNPDLIEAGPIAMRVLDRGGKYFLRVWDRESPTVKNFNGLKYYPVDPSWRITAQFKSFNTPLILRKTNMIGTEYDQAYSGTATFEKEEKEYSLIAEEDEEGLLFSFVDETRCNTTYPGGRCLLTAKPVNNIIILDFNLAVNWPCAYTSYATCPIPPAENHLSLRVEAGEMRYSK